MPSQRRGELRPRSKGVRRSPISSGRFRAEQTMAFLQGSGRQRYLSETRSSWAGTRGDFRARRRDHSATALGVWQGDQRQRPALADALRVVRQTRRRPDGRRAAPAARRVRTDLKRRSRLQSCRVAAARLPPFGASLERVGYRQRSMPTRISRSCITSWRTICPRSSPEQTLRAVISWARYGELFAYDEISGVFSLDNPG